MLVAKGHILNNETPTVIVSTKDAPPLSIEMEQIKRLVGRSPTNFSIGVRLKTARGYRSAIKSMLTVEIQPLNGTSLVVNESEHLVLVPHAAVSSALLMVWALVLCSLVVGLVIFVVYKRHIYHVQRLDRGSDSRIVSWLKDDVSIVTTSVTTD